MGEEEQHAFGLDVVLGHDRWLPVAASGASFFVLSRLAVEQHFLGLAKISSFAEDSSVAGMAQHEGNPILSISVQRHSARSRADFHWARECCITVRGVDRASSRGSLGICVCMPETRAIAVRHFSGYYQWQVLGKERTRKYHHSMNPCEIGCGERHTQGVRKGAIVIQNPCWFL